MLFVRHPGAISHHPDERVDRDDVATAIEVCCRLVQSLADREIQQASCTSET
jgi:allantoate deiminase